MIHNCLSEEQSARAQTPGARAVYIHANMTSITILYKVWLGRTLEATRQGRGHVPSSVGRGLSKPQMEGEVGKKNRWLCLYTISRGWIWGVTYHTEQRDAVEER